MICLLLAIRTFNIGVSKIILHKLWAVMLNPLYGTICNILWCTVKSCYWAFDTLKNFISIIPISNWPDIAMAVRRMKIMTSKFSTFLGWKSKYKLFESLNDFKSLVSPKRALREVISFSRVSWGFFWLSRDASEIILL